MTETPSGQMNAPAPNTAPTPANAEVFVDLDRSSDLVLFEPTADQSERVKARMKNPPIPSGGPLKGTIPFLPASVIQGEWDQTLARIREVAVITEANEFVDALQWAYVTIKRKEGIDVDAIERMLFDNLLLAPRSKTLHPNTIVFVCDWLWRWRKAVPYQAEKAGAMSSLAPWMSRDQWTYRYNEIEVEE